MDFEQPSDIFYDFTRERYAVLLLGSYTYLRNPRILYYVNLIAIGFVILLYTYGVIAGIYTMFYIAQDKSLLVQALYGTGLLCVSFGLHIGRILSRKSLLIAKNLIRQGIFKYNEDFQSGYIEIKRKRIKQLQFLVSFITNGMFFCAFNNTVIAPLMQVFFGGDNFDENTGLNLYLPFQIYIPFSTRNYAGYVVAFIVNAFAMFTMYASFACHEELYMCTALQLATEMEVLSFSLKNIQKRALIMVKKRGFGVESWNAENELVYQKCLYICLRENILHHHAILRFRDATRPYVEATTTVVLLFFSLLMAAAIGIMLQNTRPQLTLITDIFGFLPMCWVGQILADQSSQTKNFLFDIPWLGCDKKLYGLLKIFMTHLQKPLMIRAKGVNINICLETFADMVTVGYKILSVMR